MKFTIRVTQHIDNDYVIEAESLEKAMIYVADNYGDTIDPVADESSYWTHDFKLMKEGEEDEQSLFSGS